MVFVEYVQVVVVGVVVGVDCQVYFGMLQGVGGVEIGGQFQV